MKIFLEHGQLANAEEMLELEKSPFCNKGNWSRKGSLTLKH